MRITIDTKTDSRDEIRKVIKMLMGIVGGHDIYSNEAPQEKVESQPNIFENPSSSVPNLMGMFDNAPSTTTVAPPTETEEKTDDIPKIEFY